MKDFLLEGLNDEQRAAVVSPNQSALVLAGAGSGKTKVLVHRIAWLFEQGISPYSILAVTFTNKAAQEMRERIVELVDVPIRGMWVGTFHGLCHRILRIHYEQAGLPSNFQVLDSQDQVRLVKRVIKVLNVDESTFDFKMARGFINHYKEKGKRPEHIQPEDNTEEKLIRFYIEYEKYCKNSGLVDFTELLLRTVELLRDNDDVLKRYHNRFLHILVDEFQDTNVLQYSWLRLLAGENVPVFAVGDDDQSIYGWRGAEVRNMKKFDKDFHCKNTFRLERNYRSTGTILKAANSLIKNNQARLGKDLWTQEEDGEKILVFGAFNEREEASFVVDQAEKWEEQGRSYKGLAVLYRSNAQSRVIEEALITKRIPYKVYGGLRFFERAVIKHVLAYVRIASNHNDDPSLERIINFPPRGIGTRTLELLREKARQDSCSLWNAGIRLLEEEQFSPRASGALTSFYALIESLDKEIDSKEALSQLSERAVNTLKSHYQQKTNEESLSAIENLNEFMLAVKEFEKTFEDEELLDEEGAPENVVDAFLTRASLEAGEGQANRQEDYVQLMTLHSAKGLEFPFVIIVGLEEDLFPHERSMSSTDELEEERRLCYVGITRARERLALSYAEERKRFYGGAPMRRYVSRFIEELPPELLNEVRRNISIKVSSKHTSAPNFNGGVDGLKIGTKVSHSQFGEGFITDCEGAQEHSRVKVRFQSGEEKWLVVAYANLVPLS